MNLSLFHGVSMIRADASVSRDRSSLSFYDILFYAEIRLRYQYRIVATSFINATRIGKLAPISSSARTPVYGHRACSAMAFHQWTWMSDKAKETSTLHRSNARQQIPIAGIYFSRNELSFSKTNQKAAAFTFCCFRQDSAVETLKKDIGICCSCASYLDGHFPSASTVSSWPRSESHPDTSTASMPK